MGGPDRPGRGLLVPALRRGGRAIREGARLSFDRASGLVRATTAAGPLRGYRLGLFDKLGAESAKGGVAVHDGNRWTPLGVGTDDHVLTADSAEASGVKWAAGGSLDETVPQAGGVDTGWRKLPGGFARGLGAAPTESNIQFNPGANYRPYFWYLVHNNIDMVWWSHSERRHTGFLLPSGLSTLKARFWYGPQGGTSTGNAYMFLRLFQFADGGVLTAAAAWDEVNNGTFDLTGLSQDSASEGELTLDLTQSSGYDAAKLSFVSFGRDANDASDTANGRHLWLYGAQLEVQ